MIMRMFWISMTFAGAAGLGRITWALAPDHALALVSLTGALFLALWGALLLRKLLWETAP